MLDKNKELELELSEYMDKYFELEKTVKIMKKSYEKNFTALNDLESLTIQAENLKKSLIKFLLVISFSIEKDSINSFLILIILESSKEYNFNFFDVSINIGAVTL